MSPTRQPPSTAAFGERVRTLRRAAGLSQEQLGQLAGLHRTYVSALELGTRNVGLRGIVRLATALGVDPADLVAGLTPDPPPPRPH
ncbi:MAG TPA: helix-turn-helix transcriptional regulator [Acidimicrobiales bacterium]|jgi:transcriptional regulator with XRE-family HTH domain